MGAAFVRTGLVGNRDLARVELLAGGGRDVVAVVELAVGVVDVAAPPDVTVAVGVREVVACCDELVHAPRNATEKMVTAHAPTKCVRIPRS